MKIRQLHDVATSLDNNGALDGVSDVNQKTVVSEELSAKILIWPSCARREGYYFRESTDFVKNDTYTKIMSWSSRPDGEVELSDVF